MGRRNTEPFSDEVDQLREQVQTWRQAKVSLAEPMPKAIWGLAVRLAKQFGTCRVAQAVGLDYAKLRRKVEQDGASLATAHAPAFLEVPAAMMLESRGGIRPQPFPRMTSGCGALIDLASPDGAQMQIRLEPGDPAVLVGIVSAFLGRGH